MGLIVYILTFSDWDFIISFVMTILAKPICYILNGDPYDACGIYLVYSGIVVFPLFFGFLILLISVIVKGIVKWVK
jgi:hypothetical protein